MDQRETALRFEMDGYRALAKGVTDPLAKRLLQDIVDELEAEILKQERASPPEHSPYGHT